MSKIKIEDIRKEAKIHNWKVITNEYVNLNTEMTFECTEGHKVYLPFKKIRNKWECPVCQKNNLKEQNFEVAPKKKGVQRVLALDQATRVSGFSIFDDQLLIKSGVLRVDEVDEIERDSHIKQWLISMIKAWQPDLVGLEDIQLQNFNNKIVGVTTYKVLAHLQGILMECCYELGVDYIVCAPATWRSHCKVKGKTKTDMKKSMQLLVKKWFDITVTNDEADAIGIGKYIAETKKKKVKIVNWED